MTVLAQIIYRKTYGKRSVVKDVSFSVSQGEVVGILGPMAPEKQPAFI